MHNFSVTICAVIFGADESVLKLTLPAGYEFRRMSLMPPYEIDCLSIKPHDDGLGVLLKTDELGLRRDYYSATINSKLDVVCIWKSYEMSILFDEAEEHYNQVSYEAGIQIDNIIRTLRLFSECTLFCREVVIRITSAPLHYNHAILPVIEAAGTKVKSKFSCTDADIPLWNSRLEKAKFPLPNELGNCHKFYDLSYHQENCIAIVLLFTCLEILFVKASERGSKGDLIAPRCARFLNQDKYSTTNNCQQLTDERLVEFYKKRNDFVHEFNNNITDDVIFILRECVRGTIKKHIEAECEFDKRLMIKQLDTEIKCLKDKVWETLNL